MNVIFILLLASFSPQRLLVVIRNSLRDSKSLQVSKILFNILVDLNRTAVWISNSSSPFLKPLETVPSLLN